MFPLVSYGKGTNWFSTYDQITNPGGTVSPNVWDDTIGYYVTS